MRPAADRDLDDQADYLVAHEGLEAGIRFYRAAEETLRLLASQPNMGKLIEYRSPVLRDVRMFPLKRFSKILAFYRPLKDGIEVVRLLHGARDIEGLFKD